ncbi:MAG: helix-turn-helix domain-containing protein [Firmicutes bacterium]|nr:helix-turn-helix domain-containing protein [Bacillota bacterium]
MTPRLAYSPKEVVEQTGLSRNAVYRAIKSGNLKSVRLGDKKILIPNWALDELLQNPKTN